MQTCLNDVATSSALRSGLGFRLIQREKRNEGSKASHTKVLSFILGIFFFKILFFSYKGSSSFSAPRQWRYHSTTQSLKVEGQATRILGPPLVHWNIQREISLLGSQAGDRPRQLEIPLYMLHRTVNACDLGSWSKLYFLRDFKKQSNRKPNHNGCAVDTCPLWTTLRGNVVRNKLQIQWSPHISDCMSRQLLGSSFHITYFVFVFLNVTFSSPHVIHFGNLLSKLLG